MAHPRISIIVPVYNAEIQLSRCLDSLLSQVYDDFEIICVDDGSTDSSLSILLEYSHRNSRLKVIHQQNSGVSSARNRALEVVDGDIVGFCDSDDVYTSGAFQYIGKVFESGSWDILLTAYGCTDKDGQVKTIGYTAEETCPGRQFLERMMYDNRVKAFTWNKFFRKSLLVDVRFDEGLSHCEDMHFIATALRRRLGVQVLVSPVVTYTYHYNNESLTRDYGKLLTEKGELKYSLAMEKIVALYEEDREIKSLVRATQFRQITENIKLFRLDVSCVKNLVHQALGFAPHFLWCRKSSFSFIKRFVMCLKLLRYLPYLLK